MASRGQGTPNARQIGAGREGTGDRKFGNVVRLYCILAGEMELALQVALGDLHVTHGHVDFLCPSNCMSAGRLTPRRIISVAKVCLSWWQVIGWEQSARPATRCKAWRRFRYRVSGPERGNKKLAERARWDAGASARRVRIRVTIWRTCSSTGTSRSV